MEDGSGAGAAGGIAVMLTFLLIAALYFIPTTVAVVRKHHQIGPVVLINLLLGWTFVGWVVALVIASSATRQPTVHAHYYGGPGYPPAGYPPAAPFGNPQYPGAPAPGGYQPQPGGYPPGPPDTQGHPPR